MFAGSCKCRISCFRGIKGVYRGVQDLPKSCSNVKKTCFGKVEGEYDFVLHFGDDRRLGGLKFQRGYPLQLY